MITSFTGQYAFLSNFFIEPDNSCVEIEYQESKHIRNASGEILVKCINMTPAQAKRWGRKIPLRPDWEEVKLDIMFELVYRKFGDHPELWDALRATGTQELVEGNWWGDTFWGVCRGRGDNHLGKILMQVRNG